MFWWFLGDATFRAQVKEPRKIRFFVHNSAVSYAQMLEKQTGYLFEGREGKDGRRPGVLAFCGRARAPDAFAEPVGVPARGAAVGRSVERRVRRLPHAGRPLGRSAEPGRRQVQLSARGRHKIERL